MNWFYTLFGQLISWLYSLSGHIATWVDSLSNKSWFSGFLSGVVAVLLGLILTMVWEAYKNRKESRLRDSVIQRCILEDIRTNRDLVKFSLDILSTDINKLTTTEIEIKTAPLIPMQVSFWDLAKMNLSPKLLIGNKLHSLKSVVYLGNYINYSGN